LRPAAAPTTLARLAVAVVGAALLAAGAVAVFVTANSAGAAALVAAGAVLVVVTLFANQLESVEGGGFKMQLGAVAAKLREAEQADASGDVVGAEQLRDEARSLLDAMAPIAARYESVREHSPRGRARSEAGELVDQARQLAQLDFVNMDAVAELFRSGQDGNRITALGLMRGNPRLVSISIVTEVIRRPRSSFEQWHALRICLDAVREGGERGQYEAIREAIAVARSNGSIGNVRDQSRIRLAQQIEDAMESG
jgi:ribosomal protein S9